jgi:hypothetical protein
MVHSNELWPLMNNKEVVNCVLGLRLFGHQEGNDENGFHGSPIEVLVLQMTTQTTKITI